MSCRAPRALPIHGPHGALGGAVRTTAALLMALAFGGTARAAGTRAENAAMMAGVSASMIDTTLPTGLRGGTPSPGPQHLETLHLFVRGGEANPSDLSLYGAQLGTRWELDLGATRERVAGARLRPGGRGLFEGAARVYAFNLPFEGAVVAHAGLEIDDAARWWSSGWQVGIVGGASLLMAPTPWMGIELNYTWLGVGLQVGASGARPAIRPVEHRLAASVALGPVGIGARFVRGRQTVLTGKATGSDATSRQLGAFLEWRFESPGVPGGAPRASE